MDYQLELKQIVDFPRCRIYREFIQTLMKDRSIRTNGGSCLFYLCHSKNKPPAMQGEDRSLDISMNSCAKIKVGLQNHK